MTERNLVERYAESKCEHGMARFMVGGDSAPQGWCAARHDEDDSGLEGCGRPSREATAAAYTADRSAVPVFDSCREPRR